MNKRFTIGKFPRTRLRRNRQSTWCRSLISETKLSTNTTGTGLFDKEVINRLKKINDPYPYFRGLISEIGFKIETIKFHQPLRKFGITK